MISSIIKMFSALIRGLRNNLAESHRAYELEREKQKLLFSTSQIPEDPDQLDVDDADDVEGDSLETLFHPH